MTLRIGCEPSPSAAAFPTTWTGLATTNRWSITCCLPAGLADRPSAGTGTVMRAGTLERYAREAGFSGIEVLPIDHDTFLYYRLVS
jgi:hypothetical protein